MRTTLNFRGREKLKKNGSRYLGYKRALDIEFEGDLSVSLGSMIGDRQTDRQTHTHTHTVYRTHF